MEEATILGSEDLATSLSTSPRLLNAQETREAKGGKMRRFEDERTCPTCGSGDRDERLALDGAHDIDPACEDEWHDHYDCPVHGEMFGVSECPRC